MRVSEAMTRDVRVATPGQTIRDVAKMMAEADAGSVPVGENDRLIGMVTDRDIAIRALANGKDVSKLVAKDVMSKDVIYCRDTEAAEDAIRLMEDNQVRRLPVLNESKQLVGMISLGDISHALSQDLTGEVTRAVSAHHV